jgi:hypothetical protein
VACKSCASGNQRKFSSEIAVHFRGLKNLDKPAVLLFPEILVCIDCGFTKFTISETELLRLGKDASPRGTTTSAAAERFFDLSEFLTGLRIGSDEVGIREHAADEPLAPKNSVCR